MLKRVPSPPLPLPPPPPEHAPSKRWLAQTPSRDLVPHPGRSLAWGRWAITSNDPMYRGEGQPDTGEDYGPAPGAR